MSKHDHSTVQVEYLHLCDYAFVAQNNKPGVIGIFDQIFAPSFPVAFPMMCIAVQLRGQPGHIVPLRISLEAQDGTKVVDIPELRIALGPDGGSFGCVNAVNTTFQAPGRYSVVVSTPDEVLVTKTLKASRVQAQAASA